MKWKMMNNQKRRFQQALMEMLGRPIRNSIICIAVFILVFFCGLIVFGKSAVDGFYNIISDVSGLRVVVESETYSSIDDWEPAIDFASKHEYVSGYNNAYSEEIRCRGSFYKGVSRGTPISKYENADIYVSGNIKTEYNDFFREKIFSLVDGNYPGRNSVGAMIPVSIADENNISIGDRVVISYNQQELELEVIGVYSSNTIPKWKTSDNHYEEYKNNIIFIDYGSYEKINDAVKCYAMYFYSSDYESVNLLYDDMRRIFRDVPETAVVNSVKNEELQMTNVFYLLKYLMNISTGIIISLCVIGVSMLTLLWLRGHSKMISIYISLGQTNREIIYILIYEILMITLSPLILAMICISYLMERYSFQLFHFVATYFEISAAEIAYSENIWSFSFNLKQFIMYAALIEITMIVILLIGCIVYVCLPVKVLKILR